MPRKTTKKDPENVSGPGAEAPAESQEKSVKDPKPAPATDSRDSVTDRPFDAAGSTRQAPEPSANEIAANQHRTPEPGDKMEFTKVTHPAIPQRIGYGESATFWEGDGTAIRNGQSPLGNLADLCYRSGYFPDLTPSQIAVVMLAGAELGFKPIASLIQVKMSPDKIELSDDFLRILDLVDQVNATQARIVNKPPSKREAAADSMRKEIERKKTLNAAVLSDPKPKEDISPAPGPETQTAPASAAPGNVVSINREPEKTIGDEMREICEPAADDPDKEFEARIGSAPTPAAIPESEDPYKGFDDAIKEAVPSYVPPASMEETVAAMAAEKTTGASAALPAAIGGGGDETLLAVQTWRTGIERMTTELAVDMPKIVVLEKLGTFDSANTLKKRELFETVQRFYDEQTDKYRAQVLEAFERKGWTIIEHWRGFCVFAGVDANPNEWSYDMARKLRAELIAEKSIVLPN